MATNPPRPPCGPLRVFCVGTLFVANTLNVDNHPDPSSCPSVRAHEVSQSRGGSASSIASVLAQMHNFLPRSPVEPALIASLAENDEGKRIIRQLQKEGVITRFSKFWSGYTVPSAWVIRTPKTGACSIINHNSLPDLSHEDFIALIGPTLAPENFGYFPPTTPPGTPSVPLNAARSSNLHSPLTPKPNSPAPFDWLHFEGRSVKTTLNNIIGVQSLAADRHWRSHCVFSIDLGRKYRQGIEALIPHADVIFVNRHYAQATSPSFSASPRAYLLSLTSTAPPHSLLVADWGKDGAAVLSIPTRDYFQSSVWVDRINSPPEELLDPMGEGGDRTSVRTASAFWANGRETPSSTHSSYNEDTESEYTQRRRSPAPPAARKEEKDDLVDEVGASDAFIAGMIYALTRSILPGSPYTPSNVAQEMPDIERLGGKWRLEECLRFATELAGRKARRNGWNGLAKEMAEAGWAA
ncbi:Ribokinase-like protein [Flagelloscypha sp. PMI_526]|nr:Ribokinase-like protein [Flagelloscypha sp. PMI_526]